MDYSNIFKQLITKFPQIDIKKNHPLAPYTTLKIGGPADIFIHTKTSSEFLEILKFLYNEVNNFTSHYITILGNGSNVLISDTGIRGIVIKNESNEIEIIGQNKAKVSSGTQLSFTLNFLADHNLSGLEEFAYIPSTIGGAVFGNIHSFEKHNFSSILESIEVFDLNTSQTNTLLSSELKWGYDESYFQKNPNLVILSAILQLKLSDGYTIRSTAQEIIKTKTATQLMNSAGCTFKNPSPDIPAGLIIDQKLRLKGKQVGGAQISPFHANFIINTGTATATDYHKLAKFIQNKAKKQLGIKLEMEVKLLGKF